MYQAMALRQILQKGVVILPYVVVHPDLHEAVFDQFLGHAHVVFCDAEPLLPGLHVGAPS
jgi:hypothetical protein